MLKKHKALSSYYKKQTKVRRANEDTKELNEYNMMIKKEDQETKMARMEQRRESKASQQRDKLLIQIAEKEAKAEEAVEVSSKLCWVGCLISVCFRSRASQGHK